MGTIATTVLGMWPLCVWQLGKDLQKPSLNPACWRVQCCGYRWLRATWSSMDTHSRYQSMSTQHMPGVSWALGPHPESAPWRCPPGAHSMGSTQQGRGGESIPSRQSGKGMLPALGMASAQGQEGGEAEELTQEPHAASQQEPHAAQTGGHHPIFTLVDHSPSWLGDTEWKHEICKPAFPWHVQGALAMW